MQVKASEVSWSLWQKWAVSQTSVQVSSLFNVYMMIAVKKALPQQLMSQNARYYEVHLPVESFSLLKKISYKSYMQSILISMPASNLPQSFGVHLYRTFVCNCQTRLRAKTSLARRGNWCTFWRRYWPTLFPFYKWLWFLVKHMPIIQIILDKREYSLLS